MVLSELPGGVTGGLSLLTVEEAARLLGVTGEAVRRACRDGRLDAVRLGDGPRARYRITSEALARYLRDAHRSTVEIRA